MAFAASRAWLVSWDKFVIPWPFARIAIAVGPPVSVSRIFNTGDHVAVEALQAQLEQALLAQYEAARDALRATK
jgi:lysophospholipid acyltransferase (LPLAT)-like uncharacterized protein